jgi:hypothetical protein
MQKRFVGYQDDLTQENLLFMVKANSEPGVKYGLTTFLNTSDMTLTIAPGYMILPDGMVIGETEPVKIQLVEPGTGDYWATLIATRLIEPGMMNDEVRYEVVQNKVAADALTNITNLVRMPLAWIQKVGSLFTVMDLGQRSLDAPEILVPPFPQIYTPIVDLSYTDGILFRNFKNTDSAFYLKIPENKDRYISSIRITARGDAEAVLSVEALKTFENGNSTTIKTNMSFSATSYTTQTLVYPFRAYSFSDILKLQVSGVSAVNISEIAIDRTRLF